MREKSKYCLWLLLEIACWHHVNAQVPANKDTTLTKSPTDTIPPANAATPAPVQFTVRHIVIEGNKKTRPEIILREIPFKPGEGYILQELVKKFEIARQQLINTTLFHEVVVSLKSFDLHIGCAARRDRYGDGCRTVLRDR